MIFYVVILNTNRFNCNDKNAISVTVLGLRKILKYKPNKNCYIQIIIY